MLLPHCEFEEICSYVLVPAPSTVAQCVLVQVRNGRVYSDPCLELQPTKPVFLTPRSAGTQWKRFCAVTGALSVQQQAPLPTRSVGSMVSGLCKAVPSPQGPTPPACGCLTMKSCFLSDSGRSPLLALAAWWKSLVAEPVGTVRTSLVLWSTACSACALQSQCCPDLLTLSFSHRLADLRVCQASLWWCWGKHFFNV